MDKFRTLVVCIEGYIEWAFTSRKNSVYAQVEPICQTLRDDFGLEIISKKFQSIGFWQISSVLKWIQQNSKQRGDRLAVYAKSAGAIKAIEMLVKNTWLFEHFTRTTLMLIDPHGAIAGDGKVGPYKKNNPIMLPKELVSRRGHELLYVGSVFQDQATPSGARVYGADACVCLNGYRDGEGKEMTHFNIVRAPQTYQMNVECLMKVTGLGEQQLVRF